MIKTPIFGNVSVNVLLSFCCCTWIKLGGSQSMVVGKYGKDKANQTCYAMLYVEHDGLPLSACLSEIGET